jgi:hypothetical protein
MKFKLNQSASGLHAEVRQLVDSCGQNNGVRFIESTLVEVELPDGAANTVGAMIISKLERAGCLKRWSGVASENGYKDVYKSWGNGQCSHNRDSREPGTVHFREVGQQASARIVSHDDSPGAKAVIEIRGLKYSR